jgi:hypothetical protein
MRNVVAHGRGGRSGSASSFSSIQRGYFLRDVAHGILPEEDECIEALSHCLDVRDLYRPPNREPGHDDSGADGEDF